MDPEVSVLLHCADWRGLVKSQVHVELSERFNRQTDPVLEQNIDEVWKERIINEPWLFNGAKFRLHSLTLTPPPSLLPQATPPTAPQTLCKGRCGDAGGGDSPTWMKKGCLCDKDRCLPAISAFDAQLNSSCGRVRDHIDQSGHTDRGPSCGVNEIETRTSTQTTDFNAGEPRVCNMFGTKLQPQLQPGPERDTCRKNKALLTLRLGLTCYKDFLGTNWSQKAGELRRRGETEFGDPLALLAQPLGVGGVLCTRDGQVVLIRRSQRVAEAGGLLDIPGGHPEPKAVCEGVCVREDKISVELLQKREEAVVTELFSSVCTEIRDEVNVPMGSLGEPVLMGVALNHTSSGRPSAEFYIRCSLSSAEIRELYWQGGTEAHESTDIVFLSQTDLLQLDKSSPLWSELCPSAKGAVVLYQLVLPDHEADSTKPTQSPSTSTS
ncbi:uridine diphosphate glucose pyrophosphatase NUDT22 [Osmerus eperlanus]|uniref:uridine diphosphate glucose pyrophosphatase NUDT22 n=1 Tax=Osmerus eperlanus TaxID=29151 RepID=UPI002E10C387